MTRKIESIMVMDVKATSQQFADKTKASINFWVKRVDFFEKKNRKTLDLKADIPLNKSKR